MFPTAKLKGKKQVTNYKIYLRHILKVSSSKKFLHIKKQVTNLTIMTRFKSNLFENFSPHKKRQDFIYVDVVWQQSNVAVNIKQNLKAGVSGENI